MAYQIKKDPISKIPKVQLAFWLLVRLAMLICAGYSFIHGDAVMGFESIFCFIFTHLWDLFQIFGNGSFIEEVPPLSQTLLNIIIFIGIVFGSYLGLFDKLAHFDDFMHLLSGFVCAAFGFDFARIIQRKKGPCARDSGRNIRSDVRRDHRRRVGVLRISDGHPPRHQPATGKSRAGDRHV